jgi:sugar lactone lactonase YvrE
VTNLWGFDKLLVEREGEMSFLRTAGGFLVLTAAIMAHGQEYIISTFAGGAPPATPVLGVDMPLESLQGVATDVTGNTYFAAFHCLFRLDQNGVVTRIAGTGRAGYSGDGGPATSAELRLESITPAPPMLPLPAPPGLVVDHAGNVYVADNGNYRIRKISPDGTITTVAGNGTPGFSGDGGPATSAQLSSVPGLALDLAGNLWIADSGANRIRRVTPDGNIATVAGTGACGFSGDGGPAVAAQLCVPGGIAADSAGNVFIADTGNSRVRQVLPDGSIATIAGAGVPDYTDLGDCIPTGDSGTATSANVCLPGAIAVDAAGNVFVGNYNGWAEVGPSSVRKISPGGMISTVAGFNCPLTPWTLCFNVPGLNTSATKTLLGGWLALAVDSAGNLLIADSGPQQYAIPNTPHILKVSADGTMATVAGNGQSPFSGDGGPATSAQLASPQGVAVDGVGNLFIADYANDRIRKVSSDGIITTLAGNGTYGYSGDGGPAASAQMAPFRLTLDGAGNLFFFDIPNRSIRKISPDGIITTVTQVGGNDYFVAADETGDLFIADPNNTLGSVVEVSPDGAIRRVAGGNTGCGAYNGCSGLLGDGGAATSAQLVGPQGVAVDTTGNIFIADTYDHRIRKVTPDGIITTIAGNSPTGAYPGDAQGGFSGDGGPAIDAQLSFPVDVAVDGAGNVYIADSGNNRIRKVSPDGIIRTIAGNGAQTYSGDGGPAIRASLSTRALAVDSAGNVYVADTENNAIRVLRPVSHHRHDRP